MWIVLIIVVLLIAVSAYDLTQRRHAILRNFPIIGHFRYLLEKIGPELRQYIVTDNDEERPFSRDQRRWVYATSKKENDYFGFGTDNDMDLTPNYLIIKQSQVPIFNRSAKTDPLHPIPCAKILGGYRKRKKAFRMNSVVNVSAMSYGSLSAPATEAINHGCRIAGCLHNSGEGGISPHHLHGGELIWQIGTGYFGCRNQYGTFSLDRLKETIAHRPEVRAIEIKLSQGGKAGLGGIVPGVKVSEEIAQIRGIPVGRDCLSPPSHSSFRGPDQMLDFIESIADATGLPVGVKSAVGQMDFWKDLALLIETTGRSIDFLTIDGGEGGTGAGPLVFTDHVSLPFKQAFPRVYLEFAERGLHRDIVFGGSAKLGFPESALLAFGLGCDFISIAREAMLAIGCIQAQRCHTDHCPTGVATQNKWLIRGLDPTLKSARLANYIITLRKEIIRLCHACGVEHPSLITAKHFEILDGNLGSRRVEEVFKYPSELLQRSEADIASVAKLMGSGA